ncbi:MAG TPA: PIN domain-containing protein, partial [Longimicrobiaceae bacterium]
INVLLDVFLKRQPWGSDAARLLTAVEERRATGCVAGHTITTAHYVIARLEGRQAAASAVSDLLRMVEVVPVEKDDFHQSLALGFKDFEDAVQTVCGMKAAADAIVTRDAEGFTASPVRVLAPATALHLLGLPR